MSIIISEENTGRELEIYMGHHPADYHDAVEDFEGEDFADYDGPMGSVYYQERGEGAGLPTAWVHFKDLAESVRKEIAGIGQEAARYLKQAKELIGGREMDVIDEDSSDWGDDEDVSIRDLSTGQGVKIYPMNHVRLIGGGRREDSGTEAEELTEINRRVRQLMDRVAGLLQPELEVCAQ